jgi:RHS repeat-associated protein
MSGKEAARITDKVGGGVIVTGSLTVKIGSQGGIACKNCPGGKAVGSPVNPISGNKVLSDEVDFALPGPMALSWSRSYNSYISKDNVNPDGSNVAHVGLLGPGWHLPSSLTLVLDALHPTAPTRLFDGKGRVISFDEALNAGSLLDSPSEGLSLYRPLDRPMAKRASKRATKANTLDNFSDAYADLDTADVHTSNQIKRHLNWVALANPLWTRSSDFILAWSTAGSTVWVFSKTTGQTWQLIAHLDNFGRTLLWQHDRFGLLQGFTDGAGRRYRLALVDIYGTVANLPYTPDALDDSAQNILKRPPKLTPWGLDNGLRLSSVYLTHDPHFAGHASAQQPVELVRYVYSDKTSSYGDLAQVLDTRSDTPVILRQFTTHQGLMTAHSYAGRHTAPSQYRYETVPPVPGQRVVYQSNEGGLNYTFQYNDSQYNEAGGYAGDTTVTDSLGRVEVYRYAGPAGLRRLKEQVYADGSSTQFVHDQHGRLTAEVDPLGRETSYSLDAQGALLGIRSAAGASSSMRDANTGKLLSHSGFDGSTTYYAYDAQERLVKLTAPDGTSTQFGYGDNNGNAAMGDNPSTITDASGKDKQLQWSALGQMLAYTDCSNQTTRYQYHHSGQLALSTDALGHSSRFDYDALDRRIASHHADGRIERYSYDSASRLIALTEEGTEAGSQDVSTEVKTGKKTKKASASTSSSTTTYQYDARGRIAGAQRAGLQLGYRWDSADRLTALTNENHASSSFGYDNMDRLVQEEGFDGRTQQYAYDAASRLIAKREKTPNLANELPTTIYRYDAVDQLIQRQLPASAHACAALDVMSYDKAGRLLKIERKLERQIDSKNNSKLSNKSVGYSENSSALVFDETPQSTLSFSYDSMGRLVSEKQELHAANFSHTLTHAYDALGNRISSQLPSLGAAGNLAWHTYGSGHVHGVSLDGQDLVHFERDKLHRETERRFGALGNPLANPLSLTRQFDAVGRMLNQRISGVPNQPASTSSAAPQIDTLAYLGAAYGYDGSGQLASLLKVASLTPNAITPNDKTLTQYSYDSAQRLVAWERDGHMNGATAGSSDTSTLANWRFDPAGNRLPTVSASGKAASKGATGDTAHTTASDWHARVQQNLNNPHFNLLEPDQNPSLLPEQRIERWQNNRVDFNGSQVYTHDAYGNLIKLEELTTKTTTQYGYDGEHRLVWLQKSTINSIAAKTINTPATSIITTVRYTYDALGRRLQKVVSLNNESTVPTTTHFGWDGDRLVSTETASSKVHTVYEPGSFVPLLRISQDVNADSPKTEAEATEANARGLLALASKHGKPEKAVNPDDKPKEPIKLPGFGTAQWAALSKSFAHLAEKGYPEHIKTVLRQGGLDPDKITAMAKAAVAQQQAEQTSKLTIQMYHCNHLGTPIALINTQGMIDWAVELDPWGNVLNEFNPMGIDQPIRMQGQQVDRESGLFYNRHRYYDPNMGRYITQDPIGLYGGVNLYGYVNNPMQMTDPMGLAADINWFPKTDPLYQSAQNVIPSADNIIMGGHGSSTGIQKVSGPVKKCEEIVKEIKKLPKYKTAKKITLLSCQTGKGAADEEEPVAQCIARKTGLPVDAPNELMWFQAPNPNPVGVGPYNASGGPDFTDRANKVYTFPAKPVNIP